MRHCGAVKMHSTFVRLPVRRKRFDPQASRLNCPRTDTRSHLTQAIANCEPAAAISAMATELFQAAVEQTKRDKKKTVGCVLNSVMTTSSFGPHRQNT